MNTSKGTYFENISLSVLVCETVDTQCSYVRYYCQILVSDINGKNHGIKILWLCEEQIKVDNRFFSNTENFRPLMNSEA